MTERVRAEDLFFAIKRIGLDWTEAEIFSVLDHQEQIQMYRMEKKILTQLTRMEDSEKKKQEVYLP